VTENQIGDLLNTSQESYHYTDQVSADDFAARFVPIVKNGYESERMMGKLTVNKVR
jgi:hypothetical protein